MTRRSEQLSLAALDALLEHLTLKWDRTRWKYYVKPSFCAKRLPAQQRYFWREDRKNDFRTAVSRTDFMMGIATTPGPKKSQHSLPIMISNFRWWVFAWFVAAHRAISLLLTLLRNPFKLLTLILRKRRAIWNKNGNFAEIPSSFGRKNSKPFFLSIFGHPNLSLTNFNRAKWNHLSATCFLIIRFSWGGIIRISPLFCTLCSFPSRHQRTHPFHPTTKTRISCPRSEPI